VRVHRFHQLDVFTTTPLAGNPLAVFPDARGMDAATMQALAREMNLSETTFVLPSETATRRVGFYLKISKIPGSRCWRNKTSIIKNYSLIFHWVKRLKRNKNERERITKAII